MPHNFNKVLRCKTCNLSMVCYLKYWTSSIQDNCTSKNIFSCCGGAGISIWNNKSNQFECAECKAPKSTDPSYLGGTGTYAWPDPLSGSIPKHKSCTCGAEKTHGKNTSHSSWCDKK